MSIPLPLKNYLFGSFILTFLISIFGNELEHQLTATSKRLLIDTMPPTAKCVSGIVFITMPLTGCATVHAKDFNLGSFDDITPANKLKFYFDGDPKKDSITICCDDFVAAGVNDEYRLDNQMWVEDEAGNTNNCETVTIIQDRSDVCPGEDWGEYIKGVVRTENGNECISKITLSYLNNDRYANIYGSYIFSDLNNGIYKICLERKDNPTNGVSTADIVKIRRHILEIEKLNSSYKLLAADVNRSENLTAADITEIRKLIFGLIKEFNYVPSWIFVPKEIIFSGKEFPNNNQFIPSCNSFEIKDKSLDNKDYVAIKMGDVTSSARADTLVKSQTRNYNIALSYQFAQLNNALQRTEFKLNKDIILAGIQFTLTFDATEFEFVKIENGSIQIADDQFSLHESDKGKIHIAWDRNPLENKSSSSGTLFSIIWKKKINSKSDPVLSFDSKGVQALLIDQELNEIDLTLQNLSSNSISDFVVYQDFNNQSIQIEGQVYNESNATYSIIDISGRVILRKSIQLNEGLFNESISTATIPVTALYFLKLQSGSYSKIWKFLNIQ